MIFTERNSRDFDCLVCGTCVVDIFAGPLTLTDPLGVDLLRPIGPVELTTGGIVANAGTALARMGQRVAALSRVGDDHWGEFLRQTLVQRGISDTGLVTYAEQPTSATIVLFDRRGEHCFAHHAGAPQSMDEPFLQGHMDLIARSRALLVGYYSLMPAFDEVLAQLLPKIRQTGCRTALDASGAGGSLQPLDRLLPCVDIYVPSLHEARAQTGQHAPEEMIQVFRDLGAPGIVGIKLGARGALLDSPETGPVRVDPVTPPGPVVDTTGAGDAFFAGLLAALLEGWPLERAGRFAAAAGACCVTGQGASAAVRDFSATARLAGVLETP